ncbi:TetR/AcrR family transcriptional regulator [Corynebacterium striatum]|uniref:TetR/AcrR family transcriptional regulator n=1 Tax=Corynebacterium striatum TaxID=43770 RepID=UPI00122D13D4|nr:TetR/AcrR family transcriptional regulator [Corynebacterium striatum]KAA1265090.1 TetR/AcrR family transcriptional regulator [Corynebacterium striatum]
MSSLRETKKQATRHAIADSAARLVVDEGVENLTVARIAEAAGVSPRTFHNYFSSASDALFFFAASLLDSHSDDVENLSPEMGINEFFETMLLEVLDDDQPNLHSLATLVTIGESIESMSHTAEERQRYEKVAFGIVEAFGRRMPGYSKLELGILLAAHGAAGKVALMEIADQESSGTKLSSAEKREIVHHAFQFLKQIP